MTEAVQAFLPYASRFYNAVRLLTKVDQPNTAVGLPLTIRRKWCIIFLYLYIFCMMGMVLDEKVSALSAEPCALYADFCRLRFFCGGTRLFFGRRFVVIRCVRFACTYGSAHCTAHRKTHRSAHGEAHCQSCPGGYRYAHTCCDSHPDAHPGSYESAYAHTHAYACSYAHSHTGAYAGTAQPLRLCGCGYQYFLQCIRLPQRRGLRPQLHG